MAHKRPIGPLPREPTEKFFPALKANTPKTIMEIKAFAAQHKTTPVAVERLMFSFLLRDYHAIFPRQSEIGIRRRKEIVNQTFTNHFTGFLKAMSKRYRLSYDEEELLINLCHERFTAALTRWVPHNKASLSTYIVGSWKFALRHVLKARKNKKKTGFSIQGKRLDQSEFDTTDSTVFAEWLHSRSIVDRLKKGGVDRLWKDFESLKDLEKRIISLRLGIQTERGLEFSEIATRLHMPVGTVKSNYYRALFHMKGKLGNLLED